MICFDVFAGATISTPVLVFCEYEIPFVPSQSGLYKGESGSTLDSLKAFGRATLWSFSILPSSLLALFAILLVVPSSLASNTHRPGKTLLVWHKIDTALGALTHPKGVLGPIVLSLVARITQLLDESVAGGFVSSADNARSWIFFNWHSDSFRSLFRKQYVHVSEREMKCQ